MNAWHVEQLSSLCVRVLLWGALVFQVFSNTNHRGEKVSLWFFGTLVCWWPNGLCTTFEYQIERLKWVLANKSRLPLHHGLLVLMMLMSIRFCSYPPTTTSLSGQRALRTPSVRNGGSYFSGSFTPDKDGRRNSAKCEIFGYNDSCSSFGLRCGFPAG